MELFLKVFIIIGLLEILSNVWFLARGVVPERSSESMAFSLAVNCVLTVWALGVFIGGVM